MAAAAMEVAPAELYDLLFVTDATGSMFRYLEALRQSIPDIIRMSLLTDCFSRIGVLAYRDYCVSDPNHEALTEWSGWHTPGAANSDSADGSISRQGLIRFAENLDTKLGGGAEAAKAGLALAHSVMRSEAKTIVLLYADQPPHLPGDRSSAAEFEGRHLSQPGVFGGSGSLFLDWTSAAGTLAFGEKKAQVFCLISEYEMNAVGPFLYLSTMTNGDCYTLQGRNSSHIAGISISLLLAWMGLSKSTVAERDPSNMVAFTEHTYDDPESVQDIRNEENDTFRRLVTDLFRQSNAAERVHLDRVCDASFSVSHPRTPPIPDLTMRYSTDLEYRTFATSQLMDIIDSNVSAIAANPIFGTLWRAVSADRANEQRAELLNNFSNKTQLLQEVAEPEKRNEVKAWLQESYNFTAEIQDIIRSVPSDKQYPCVFLDPTQDFSALRNNGDTQSPATFSRDDLLEIGRSCDEKILRRLGKILTRLTYVSSESDVPKHIREASADGVPRMPLALAENQYGRHFWKILLHLILPGTKISARPAALLAALSNRMGMLPLRNVADLELLAYSDKWNTLEFPETWNLNCLSLLLDADRDFEKRIADGVSTRPNSTACVLSDGDRRLFQTLVDYKMLEFNLQTTLTAKVGWKPHQTRVPMGPVVVCTSCHLPRSVTIMGRNGRCGVCGDNPRCSGQCCQTPPNHEEVININASASDSEVTEATWFECASADCRAQYVVYNVAGLRVRSKCFYCRHPRDEIVGKAPTVECVQCLSRIIWPLEYRPQDLDTSTYHCMACTSGKETIVDRATSAQRLLAENGTDWLLRNEGKAIATPFGGRSLFYTASNTQLGTFASNVAVLPDSAASDLTISGKLVRNPADLRASLASWISRRQAEQGSCGLCFSDTRKSNLRRACGRKGCVSDICDTCRDGWYGMNKRGSIINLAALCCPFCRRQPVASAVPGALARMGGLRDAVADAGWIYAWCNVCGFAKQYMERVCAQGAPAEVHGWSCEECERQPGGERELDAGRQLGAEGLKIMECPGCGVATEKDGGCDHISCPCGEHWCFECGKGVGEGMIYCHMEEEHGGLYAERYGDEWDEEG